MATSWKKLEDRVRDIASLHWKAPAQAEHLKGVDFDLVIRPSADELILIEVTEEHTLEKVRVDLARISPVRLRFMTEGMNCRGFIVLRHEPTESMVEAGREQRIHVYSLSEFEKLFFDYSGYKYLRSRLAFGSAVDPETGESDRKKYVPVQYLDSETQEALSTGSIAALLKQGEKIVLRGDFGTGKSRCTKELFHILAEDVASAGAYTLSINLREHWGSKKASEILAGHLEGVGMSTSIDSVRRLLNSGHLILLLDGLDEVGAQTLGTRRENVAQLRRNALEGVRHLVSESKHGVLITGRSHYFDSDLEMLDALGLGKTAQLISCQDEFTPDEGKEYLASIGVNVETPRWLPRKPLMFQILGTLEPKSVSSLLTNDIGEFAFWGVFLDGVCLREARIHSSLDAQYVRLLLRQIARLTRTQESFLGQITTKMINSAYEAVVHDVPDESAQQMLLRLCTLARIGPSSPERQFVDPVIADVLRAESLLELVRAKDAGFMAERWKQPLNAHGMYLLTDAIAVHAEESLFQSVIHINSQRENRQALAEMIAALLLTASSTLDFKGVRVDDAEIFYLDLNGKEVCNLTVENCVIGVLNVEHTHITASSGLAIGNCLVGQVFGVSSSAATPDWIRNCHVDTFDNVSTANRIRGMSLSPAHLLFVSIVHRIFFQPGAGRKEAALLKGGYGKDFDSRLVEKILRILMNEKLITRFKGDEGWIYSPVRNETGRMAAIKTQLTLSKDPLWAEIEKLNSAARA